MTWTNRFAWIALVSLATAGLLRAESPVEAPPPILPPAPTPQQVKFDRRSPVVIAVEKVKDAVVNVSSTRLVKVRYPGFDDALFEQLFGGLRESPFNQTVQATSLGSGVVIHPAGYVLTNAHVVARATEITCSLSENEKFQAKVVSADPARDLAVLKIESADHNPKPLPFIPMGHSNDLMIGETVIAIGNAMGYARTVTTGVVSAIDRKIPLTKDLTLDHLIQTDASINPGNSGGPLLNVNGELIGINSAIRGDAQNIGFAIPIDQARQELAMLLDFSRVNDVQFGAMLGDSPTAGLTVKDLAAKSPAAEGGLAVGDRVVSVDGRPCKSLLEFNVLMLDKAAGQTCGIGVARKDKAGATESVTLKVQLLASPKPDGNELLWKHFGMRVRSLDAEAARAANLRAGRGLLVTQLAKDSVAGEIGIQLGDVLVQVDKLGVGTLDELGAALKKVQAGQTVNMVLLRGRFQIMAPLKAK